MRNNLIGNGDFSLFEKDCPVGWRLKSPAEDLMPKLGAAELDGVRRVKISGNGTPYTVGHLCAAVKVRGGRTYKLSARFWASEDINPDFHLLFGVRGREKEKFNNGIFSFKKVNGRIEGENSFFFGGAAEAELEVMVTLRFSPCGWVILDTVSLAECEAVPSRPARIACVHKSHDTLENWERLLDYAIQKDKPDLFLLPEFFHSVKVEDTDGETVQMMSRMAKRHGIYIAGTNYILDSSDGQRYNAGFLFDRAGGMVGKYYKMHPFSPEVTDFGIMPGSTAGIFDTDFGRVGMIICYDSWFPDVTELLALKGAELILFPNAGYYMSIITARAADNCVRFAASSLDSPVGLWDTAGREVSDSRPDPTTHANTEGTFGDVRSDSFEGADLKWATFDLSRSPSPHNWGGPMLSAPGGRRNRREQIDLLYDRIKAEVQRGV